jgi:hypothetical protein
MTSADLLHEYRWPLAFALVGLFLLSRYIMRRAQARRAAQMRTAGASGEQPLVGPDGYRRARRHFLLTVLLLLVIVAVSVLTHLY